MQKNKIVTWQSTDSNEWGFQSPALTEDDAKAFAALLNESPDIFNVVIDDAKTTPDLALDAWD